LVDRMYREFKVEANVGQPRVAYRETITRVVERAEGKFVRQTGGSGQYGHCIVKLEPQEPGAGFEFVNGIKQGILPREFIKPVEEGIKEAMETGIIAGYPMVDIKATLYDGSFHDVDSSEMSFKIAGSYALKDGAEKGGSVLLEPIMAVEVVTPDDYTGDVIGYLSANRGMIDGIELRSDGLQNIKADVPLAEMFGYATKLRSMTQGRGSFSMEFKKYAPLAKNLADEVEKRKK